MRLNRRSVLAGVLAVSAVGLVGCPGEGTIVFHSRATASNSHEVNLVTPMDGFSRRITCNGMADFSGTISANEDRLTYISAPAIPSASYSLVQTTADLERCPAQPAPFATVEGPGIPTIAYSTTINTRLALTADSTAGFQLRTLSDDGSNDTVLFSATPGTALRNPVWSPDGSRIAVERLTLGPNCPPGTYTQIAILVIDANSGNVLRTLDDGGLNTFDHAWNPGGNVLAFTGADLAASGCNARPTSPDDAFDVYTAAIPNGGFNQISPVGMSNSRGPAFSPAGGAIWFIHKETDGVNDERQLVSAPSGGGSLTLRYVFLDQTSPVDPANGAPKGPPPIPNGGSFNEAILFTDFGAFPNDDIYLLPGGGGAVPANVTNKNTVDSYRPIVD